MVIELANTTGTLLQEIGDKAFNRDSVALTYAMAMASSEPTDWKAVNESIMKRWSVSGLKYIKERAWKLREEKARAARPEMFGKETTK